MAALSVLPRLYFKHGTVAGLVGAQRCMYSSDADVKPLRTTKLSSLKRGTGGRSSFSGVVATVFGASGVLGHYVVNKLGKRGTQVVIPYRGDEYQLQRLYPMGDLGQLLFYPYFLKEEEQLYKCMKYSNVVINLIGRDYETRNFTFDDVHVQGARNIARIAKDCGVERLIHVSALNCTLNPKPSLIKTGSGFMKSKFRGEQAVREEFPEATIIRPADMCGSEDRTVKLYAGLSRHSYKYTSMVNKGVGVFKQPIMVTDVASGIVAAAFDEESAGKTYQAVGPRRYELSELVDWFHRCMRKTGEDGWRRFNIKYDPTIKLKTALFSRLCPIWTGLTWERLERETFTDIVDPKLPSLEDLGITLTPLEETVPFLLYPYRSQAFYEEKFGEFAEPEPPKVVVS